MKRYWRIASASCLRAEDQAALWFQRQSAETLELDMQGLQTLEQLVCGSRGQGLRQRWQSWQFCNYLWARGFLEPVTEACHKSLELVQACLVSAQHSQGPLRSRRSPEVLQVSLTDACQQHCQGCFFSNQSPRPNRYLSAEHFQTLVQEAAALQVFQLALGGGEPLMHPQLLDFVKQASQLGLVVNLTSNGGLLTPALTQALKQAGLGQFQLSLSGATAASHQQIRPGFEAVLNAIGHCQQARLRWGLNLLVTRHNLPELEPMLELAQQQGAYAVNILRPKPSSLEPGWLNEQLPDAEGNRQLMRVLQRWQRKGRFLLQTDSSLSFLRQGPLADWQRSGMVGCSAGRSMLSVQVDGRFSPCSHLPLAEAGLGVGKLLQHWQQSVELQHFRELEERLQGACQSCDYKSVCRGCRAIVVAQSGDFWGADTQCPLAVQADSTKRPLSFHEGAL